MKNIFGGLEEAAGLVPDYSRRALSISETFAKLEERKEKALIAFTLAGYPTAGTTYDVAKSLVEGGADILEIGIPSERPVSDGPTIRAAHGIALYPGMAKENIFRTVEKIRAFTNVPIVLVGYFDSVIHAGGVDGFFKHMQKYDIQGIIIPDLPFPESKGVFNTSQEYGINLIRVTTPETPETKLEEISSEESGFHYLALGACTGRMDILTSDLDALVKRVESYSKLPIVAGFGISTPEQVQYICKSTRAKGVAIGSEIIRRLDASGLDDARELVHMLKGETKGQYRK